MNQSRRAVLVVDDKRNMLRLMAKVLQTDVDVHTASDGLTAIEVLKEEPIDAVLCDLKMPGADGLEVLRACKRLRPAAEFVLMTAFASVETAVEALRQGAYDYLTKPFEPERARTVVLRALGHASPPDTTNAEVLPGVIGACARMRDVAEFVRQIASSNATALIVGETGTGKERIARAVHRLSDRASARFVAINCAAIPAELLESELFGHARGAFTGAERARAGLFEQSNGGTLFLDEIGELAEPLQAKLTRVLEERSVRRLAEVAERAIDVRIVAATHRDLPKMVSEGSFREDLWYRVNVAVVRLPPLRERRDDIELLAQEFLSDLGPRSDASPPRALSPAALDAIRTYSWPGNVRQLRAALERASVVSSRDRIEVGDLPPEIIEEVEGEVGLPGLADLTWTEAQRRGKSEAGRAYLSAILSRFGGSVPDAAAHAGVERESFYRLLRRHGIEPESFRRGDQGRLAPND